MLLCACLLAVSPAGGLLTRAGPVSLEDLLGRRSPGERLEGARSDKLPLQRMKPAVAAPEPPSVIVEELAAAVLPEEPVVPPAVEELDLPFVIDPTPLALAPPLLGVDPLVIVVPEITRTDPSPTLVPQVPEPATWLTMLAGFGLLGLALRRSRPARALLPIRR